MATDLFEQSPTDLFTQSASVEPGFKPGDYLKAAARGAAQVPGSLTALADIPFALAGTGRPVSKLADAAGDLTGFKPGRFAKDLQLSSGAEAEVQDLNSTWQHSGADRLGNALLTNHADLPEAWQHADLASVGKAIARNPGAMISNVVESVPSMLAGGALGRGVAVASRMSPVIAGAIGEGAIAAGQNMDQTDPSVDPRKAAQAALAAGTTDALIAGAGGKLAQRMGLEDVQTAMAGGRAERAGRGTVARIAGGAASEGVLQELPQSMQEQGWQNYAEDKPLGEGVIRQGVEGAIAAAVMGGGSNVMPERAPVTVPTQDGGTVTIDPATGPLSAAAADHVREQGAAILAAAQEEVVPVPATTGDLFTDQVPDEPISPLLTWQQEADPVSLQEAQSVVQQGRDAGYDGHYVIRHGEGFTAVPKAWLNSDQVKAAEAFQPGKQPAADLFADLPSTVDQAASQANASPSEAQIAAGNYQKGHIKVGPLDIAIENPVGSTRTGPGWETKMSAHYGYIKRTVGADGDQVDVYVKAGTPTDHSGPVFVVDQFDPKTGRFDEHKAMVGYRFEKAAIKAYDAHFSDGSGPTRRKGVLRMTAEQFKDWAQNGDTQVPVTEPLSGKGFEDGVRVSTKQNNTGALIFDDTRSEVSVTPDKLGDSALNPHADNTIAKSKGGFSESSADVGKAKTSTSSYAVSEPDTISGDLFIGTEHAIPEANRKALPRQGKATPGRAGASSSVLAVRQAPDVQGIYHVSTQLVTVGERSLPVDRVHSWQDAANVFGNLSRYAVEHFDALVTDKAGKPLAIIGGFKGAPTQASVYPGTVMMELARIDGAAHIWMAHNHPSGTPDLSNADRMLSNSFASILRGSNIEYHGLAAVARTGNSIAWTNNDYDNGTASVDQQAKFKVPMVEREIIESNPGAVVSSPATAKSLVAGIAKDQPGVVFLTAQNGISAFVPFEPAEMGELRSGDRLMRLFRAASKAGGVGALVAMPDGKVTAAQFANIKGALGSIDVKVLDGIMYTDGKTESLAEKGLDSSAGLYFNDLAPALLAPNGKPSNLTKTQHAQVRTPAFKAWFGDWEASAINARVNQQLKQWAAGTLKSNAILELGHPSTILAQFGMPDLPVHLTQAILRKAVKAKHAVDVADLKDLAINIAAPIAVFGSKRGAGHIVLVTEARHADGNVVVALDLDVSRDGLAINDIRSIHPKRDESVTHWIEDGLLLGLEKRKGRDWLENSVGSNSQQPQVKAALDKITLYDTETIRNPSRVVDENGEPLVVYHGSGSAGKFTSFKPNKFGLIWAGSKRETAASYAGIDQDVTVGSAKKGVLPVFLNIRNPSETSGEGKDYFELPSIGGEDFTDGFAIQAKTAGHDGAIIRDVIDDGGELEVPIDTVGDNYAVFRPEQIKSATQNSGAFDPSAANFLNDLAADKNLAVRSAIDRAMAMEQGKEIASAKRGSARLQLAKLRNELENGKIDEAQFVTGVEKVHFQLEEAAQARKFAPLKERVRGADYIRQRLLEAKRNGGIDAEAADLAEWFILQNPALVNGLGISIKSAGQNEEGARGRYMPLPQIVRLFKGSAGTETAVHETLHHLERMMPAAMQDAIRLEYERRLAAAIKKGEHVDYFKAILAGDFKKAGALIQAGKVPYSAYQYFNASEFWAVNMAELVSDRFAARHLMFGRIKQWLVEAVQHIKAVLGLRSDAPMIKALDDLIRSGDGEMTREEMLGKGEQYLSVKAAADPEKLTVRDWIGHHLANQRSWALGALTRDQLADIYGKEMPEVADFDHVVQEMDQARNIIAEKADAIIERWRKLPAKTADALAGIMHSATLEQFDPDLKTRDEVQTPEQSILVKDWAALSPEAKQVYRDVRDRYQATLVQLRNGLSKRAERTGAMATAAEIRLQFDKYLAEGPYFPLARFGDLILIADKHEQRIVEAFESSAAREKRARQLRITGWKTKLTAKKTYSAATDGPAGEFVGDVLKLVGGLDIEAKEKAALMDSLNQLAIGALPDQSYRRHFAHRKGTEGYSQDAMRAFASSMQHVAHHVARVTHGDELTLLLAAMNKRIAEATGDVDTTVQQQVANELAKRLDLMLAPNTHPVTALAGQVGFVMSLGGSVASGLTNLSQTPLITFPWLGAKFGFDKAAGALTKAGKDYFGGRWDKWSGFVVKENDKLSIDERRALQQLEDAGLINLTQTSDLASTATTDSASSSRSWAINRAMKIIGWTFSVPEVFNRQVSALAAYRLAREKGETHESATETAGQTLRRTHFDYSASNRSRWMAGNFARVVTMFKQYSQQMTYLLWRNAHQALTGESPAVRREARRMLLGVAAMHFAAAGALGLPLGVFGITPLLGLLSMGMGDGDDPWDWEVEFRKMLADTFGKAGGEAIAHGPLRMLTNVDFASRVGLGDLWVRSPQGDKEGRNLVEAWMLTLLGPVAGYAGNLGTAAKAFEEGKVGRGFESLLPKMLAAPLKAARYETEGVRSWRGDDLGVALTGSDILGTALGFNPSRVAEMHEGRNAIKGREDQLMARRDEILNMFNAAVIAGDSEMQAEALAAATKFSMANPGMSIRADSLRHSLQTKLRNQAMIKDGVYLSKRRQDLREEGRFANVE